MAPEGAPSSAGERVQAPYVRAESPGNREERRRDDMARPAHEHPPGSGYAGGHELPSTLEGTGCPVHIQEGGSAGEGAPQELSLPPPLYLHVKSPSAMALEAELRDGVGLSDVSPPMEGALLGRVAGSGHPGNGQESVDIEHRTAGNRHSAPGHGGPSFSGGSRRQRPNLRPKNPETKR